MNQNRKADAYKEPVFIVGSPRSGTTLIQGILCNTGRYFPMPETHFFSQVVYGLPEKGLSDKDRKKIHRILARKSRIELDRGFLLKLNTQKEIFEYVVATFNTNNKTDFLEKTPRHVFFYPTIMNYYPGAKFICMIREPKNVISSQLTNSPKQNKSVIRLSMLYNKIATAILEIKGKNNVSVIKYEDLTTEPQLILERICKFLNITFDPGFIDDVSAPPGVVSEHEFWKERNIKLKTIQKNNADKWRKALTDGQANIINFITGSHAKKFGYSLSYEWHKVWNGLRQDMLRFTSPKEFKRIFSKVRG
jgi:hypothetical protein